MDWTGNRTAVFTTIGAVGHSTEDREEHDYYATEPKAMELLLEKETFNPNVWECACGEGHLSKVLENHGYNVLSTDLINRGYGIGSTDFLKQDVMWKGDIITNPPYKYALDFAKHGLDIIQEGSKLALFLKLQFLEGQERRIFFNAAPPREYGLQVKDLFA